ncbi:MFS transporter [Streptomyces sp. ACA25]|uniref:MFS transporter n=1 Tax=Streptomyces sp. ACA25 TaxID=3022596 RepID=UPI002306EC48|nr:MFS transporter [Streptomyces sp. ACA25]MDB1089967.1 MFS transporter [Streptomyces sp. ACA25]
MTERKQAPHRTAIRDFRLYWAASTTDAMGSQASGLVLPLFLLAAGYSPALAGAVVSLSMAAGLLAAPFAAVFADRGARRRTMWWSALVAAGAMGLVAALAVGGRLPLALLVSAVLVERVATSCYSAAAKGCVAALASPADYPRAVSRLQAGEQGAVVVGPVLGGVLFQVARWLPFLADALSYLVAAWCVRAIRSDLEPGRPAGPATRAVGLRSVLADLGESLRFTWRQPFLRSVLLWAAGVNGALAALYYAVLFTLQRQGTPAAAIGLVLAVTGAAGLAGALAAPWLARRIPTARLVRTVSWTTVPVAVALALVERVWWYGALFGAVSLLVPTLSVLLAARAIAVTPLGLQSRVGTALATASGITAAAAPAAAGVLVALAGTSATALVCAAALALLAGYASVTVARRIGTASPGAPAEAATALGETP